MKVKAKLLLLPIMAALSFYPLASCKNKTADNVNDVNITMSETAIELPVGETYRLTVSVSPDDPIDKKIEWRSDDENVASVSDGVVKAKNSGETRIVASTNGKETSCKVTVTGINSVK